MAKMNQVIENRKFGDKVKFLVTSEMSGGKLMKAEFWIAGNGDGPPLHFHPEQTETFEVISGQLNVTVDGKEIVLRPGETFTVPTNAEHKFANKADAPAVVTVQLEPALRFEFFLETLYSLQEQNKVNKSGIPRPLQFAAVLHEYYGEMYVTSPPVPIQKFMAKVVGGFAKILGYKGYIPFPKEIIQEESLSEK